MLPQAALAALMTVTSPDGKNTLTVARDGETVVYSVAREGKTLLAPAPIALDLKGVSLDARKATVATFTQDLSAETPFHTKRPRIALTANGATADFGGLTLTALATDQGVAYRWGAALPGDAEVRSETFTLRPEGDPELLYAYNHGAWKGDPFQNSWETPHNRTHLDAVKSEGLLYLPVTFLYKGAAMALTETELRQYPGLNLRRPKGEDALVGTLAAWPTAEDGSSLRYCRVTARADYLVRTRGTRPYPWRVFMLADTPAGLYDSDLVIALSEPAQGDFSWVRPGQVLWQWWSDWLIDGAPFKTGINHETNKAYVDFAAAFGFPYVIPDVDNFTPRNLDVMNMVEICRLRELVPYAREKGVGIALWCTWQQLIGRQEEVFAAYAKLGVVGFKIDFIDRDDAKVADFLYETARIAAKHKLLVVYHGAPKPTGLGRTFPNVLAREGVWGQEQSKWLGPDFDFVTNDLRIAFTRLLAGPTDYTPGAMRNAPKASYRADYRRPMSMGTRCRQAALCMVYDTAFRMPCDSPSAYAREPAYTRFLAALPVTWDDTRCDPSSEPDTRLLVRRAKGRDVWYAALAGNGRQSFEMPLDALGEGAYEATILRDGPIADSVGTDYVLETRRVTAKDTLRLDCAPGGGFLVRITPLNP